MSFAQQIDNAVALNFLKYQGLTTAKVLRYNKAKQTADIEFLKYREKTTSTEKQLIDYPRAYNIPCATLSGNGYTIRAGYKKDDIVFVALAISEISKAGQSTSDRAKFFSKDNAVIIGGWQTSGGPQAGDIYVGSSAANMQITETEIKFTVGAVTFKINSTGATVSVGGATVNLFTHLHSGPAQPPTPNT